jgi:uroporphyrinogen decarboxylase
MEERYAHFDALVSAGHNRFKVAKLSRCLFERAWSLRGMENLLIDFMENPSFVHELFGIIADFGLDIIESLKPFPIDAIRFSDDWGGQRGMLMSPDTWRSFIKPYMARLYAKAHERGYDVFIHCCGNILDILDDLVEIGVDVFNPIQPETMDVESVIGRYAGRLAFNGGLSIQQTLPFGTPSEVREEVENRIVLARKHGGYIVAPSHDMPPDIPVENIEAMRDVLFNQ